MQITVVSGTNRPGNLSLKVAGLCREILAQQGHDAQLLDLMHLPREIAFQYFGNGTDAGFVPFQQIINDSSHFVFVVPEYNGSIPGILKLFIDACDFPDSFRNKSAVLIGIAAGQGGNQQVLAHLKDILEYFGMDVHDETLAFGKIREKLHPEGRFSDEEADQDLRELLQVYLGSEELKVKSEE